MVASASADEPTAARIVYSDTYLKLIAPNREKCCRDPPGRPQPLPTVTWRRGRLGALAAMCQTELSGLSCLTSCGGADEIRATQCDDPGR
jgi:hypothetical protein